MTSACVRDFCATCNIVLPASESVFTHLNHNIVRKVVVWSGDFISLADGRSVPKYTLADTDELKASEKSWSQDIVEG